jgi:EmrB/QacA subfamily drug resistance transporter
MEGDAQTAKYRRRWWTLATLSLSLVIIGLDNTVLNVAIPTLRREFDASASKLQWMIDSYIIVFAGLLLTMGTLGDRLGRARALQVGLAVFGTASLAAAYAGSSDQLILRRAVMGFGGALIMPATLSIITDVFPREERGRAIAIWAGASGLGVGLGPLIGGLLLDHFWWGSVFLINVPIVVVAVVLGRFFIPESRDPHPAALDLPGAGLSIGAVATLVYVIIEAPARGWLDPFVGTGFAVAVGLGVVFLVWERRTPHPMLQLAFFANPRFSAGSAAIGIAFFALFGVILAMTQYLQFVHDYTPLEAGWRLTPLALGIALGAGNSHRLVRRLGTSKVVVAGFVLLALAMGSIATWDVETGYWAIGAGLFVMALSLGTIMAPATDAVMGAVPEAKAGIGSAMNDVTRQVFGALGVAVIGSLLNSLYTTKMADAVAGLPAEASGPASDNVGAAVQIAARIGGTNGSALAEAARSAFADSLSVTGFAAAGVALIGALMAARFLPAEQRPADAPCEETPSGLGYADHAARTQPMRTQRYRAPPANTYRE